MSRIRGARPFAPDAEKRYRTGMLNVRTAAGVIVNKRRVGDGADCPKCKEGSTVECPHCKRVFCPCCGYTEHPAPLYDPFILDMPLGCRVMRRTATDWEGKIVRFGRRPGLRNLVQVEYYKFDPYMMELMKNERKKTVNQWEHSGHLEVIRKSRKEPIDAPEKTDAQKEEEVNAQTLLVDGPDPGDIDD